MFRLAFEDISAWFLMAVVLVLIVNLIKYKGRLREFDLLVLVLLVGTNLVCFILSFFDEYTFELLSKKLFVLTFSAVILNFFSNKVIEERFYTKEIEIHWREDKLFIRVITVMSTVILVGFLSYTIWYTVPRDIDHTLEGVHFQLGQNETEEKVSINIEGELRRSISGGGVFNGTFDVEGKEMEIPPEENMIAHINYRNNGWGWLKYYSDEGTEFTGLIFSKNGLEQIVITRHVDGGWNGRDGWVISAPAENRQAGLDLARELTGYELD